MAQPLIRLQKRRNAREMFTRVMSDASRSFVIHYSCESFYERPEGASPHITSIAVRNIESGQTNSFSIHQVAERQGLKASQINQHYDELEKQMLDEFYPRLQKLVERDRITDGDFLSGPEEAAAFEEADYVKLHLSTLRKVDVMANIAHRFDEETLETNARFGDQHGTHPQAMVELLREHWLIGFLSIIVILVALGEAIYWLFNTVFSNYKGRALLPHAGL